MKKFFVLLWQEEIPQFMGVIFLFVGLITTSAVLLAPFQLPEGTRAIFYAHSNALFDWVFILVPLVAISIVVGIIMSIKLLLRQRRMVRG